MSERTEAKYISCGQIIILFAALGTWYCSSTAIYNSAGSFAADIIVSAVAAAILSAPLCILSGRYHCSVPGIIAGKWGVFGKTAALFYGLYFISAAACILRMSGIMAANVMFEKGNPLVCILLLGIVSIYISHTGTSAVCRMTSVILFLLVLGAAVTVTGSLANVRRFEDDSIIPERIEISSRIMQGIFPVMLSAAILCCILMKGAGRCAGKGCIYGIAAMLICSTICAAAVYLLLGDYAKTCDYPLADAVRFASGTGGFMLHGVIFGLWIIISAAAVGIFSAAAGESVLEALPLVKRARLICAAIVTAAACTDYHFNFGICNALYGNIILTVILLTVIPLAVLFSDRCRKGV